MLISGMEYSDKFQTTLGGFSKNTTSCLSSQMVRARKEIEFHRNAGFSS